MNLFFIDDFNISKIVTCARVAANVGAASHRNRKWHGLVVQIDGEKRYTFGTGEVLDVGPGQVFYLPKFSDYDIAELSPGSCIAINFELANEHITYPPFVCPGKNAPGYIASFKKIHKAWLLKQSGFMNVCFKQLYSIICDIQSESNAMYLPTHTRSTIEKAADMIHEHLADADLTVAHIAEAVGTSPEYLRFLFKCAYNTSPRKYIINQRISKAIDLMALGQFKIGEIAELCGFKDATYFSTVFKKATSYTPSEYTDSHFMQRI